MLPLKFIFSAAAETLIRRFCRKQIFRTRRCPRWDFRPGLTRRLRFAAGFLKSYLAAKKIISEKGGGVITGVGGFVAAPVCWAGHRLKMPVALINVDIHAGKANKLIGRFADEIFVQFEDTVEGFRLKGAVVNVVGCPMRKSFLAIRRGKKRLRNLGLIEIKRLC